ncbi:hypothetical protein [Bdellovibrio sp. BCCA]|uniref:hypothetical protein n=1 Tax=Bdellovibrio sp. BCCA TaxID=3136281 RepID=UPI0030F288E0
MIQRPLADGRNLSLPPPLVKGSSNQKKRLQASTITQISIRFPNFYRPLSKVFSKLGRNVLKWPFFAGRNLMKNEEKQEFKSSGVLALLGLVGFSTAIIATPWNRQMQDSRIETARQKAEVVGYQVVQIYREASKSHLHSNKVTGRNPASVEESKGINPENLRSTGTMGIDPWGQPYHYRILSTDSLGRVRILVWSAGPNQKIETADLDNEDAAVKEQPVYSGDDMGVLLSMAQN